MDLIDMIADKKDETLKTKQKTNPYFSALVRDLSLDGMGVVDHPSGKVFFVAGVWPGDRGDFEIESEEKRHGFAKLLKLIEKSPERRESTPCSYQGFDDKSCGGCPWMIATDEAQVSAKQKMLEQHLIRSEIILPRESIIKSILPSSHPLGIRNRAQFKTDGVSLGYFARQTNHIVDVEHCAILSDKMNEKLKELRSQLPRPEWKSTGYANHSFFDVDEETDITNWAPNQKRPFAQANELQNQKMKDWLRQKLSEIPERDQLEALELFCGSGNFTEALAQSGIRKVLAVESFLPSLKSLKEKNLNGVRTKQIDLYRRDSLSSLIERAGKAKLLVLDPPRTGYPFLAELIENLPNLETLIYISCDLNSFARDIKKLASWRASEIQPIDQFPQTPHIEILGIFKKRVASKNH